MPEPAAPLPIRHLKRRYRLLRAQGRALPLEDLPLPWPLSTGDPLADAALLETFTPTANLAAADHVNRVWNLARDASPARIAVLAADPRGLLNDAKLLLALRCWETGDDAGTRAFLAALPWGWRLRFPVAVVKPARVLFTGWRRDLRFRLVEEPRFEALRALFRELLAVAPEMVLLRYRAAIQESAALLKFRFDGDRERAIHDWCFATGAGAADLGVVGLYVRARDGLRADGISGLLGVLDDAPRTIPLPGFLGLLGGAGHALGDDPALRAYAVRCATAVESLLRLAEWGPWLNDDHAARIAANVRGRVVDEGLDIAFQKVVTAWLAAPERVRRKLLQPLFLPLLKHYGARIATRLSGPLTYVQSANQVGLMGFLLYATLAAAAPTRLVLLRKRGAETIDPIPIDEVGAHLADDREALEQWVLGRFGGLSTRWDFTYDFPAVGRELGRLDPAAPLLVDLPWTDEGVLLEALLPFEQVFNLNGTVGAPGEVGVAPESYHRGGAGVGQRGGTARGSDRAAPRFAELLERLGHFARLSDATGETPR